MYSIEKEQFLLQLFEFESRSHTPPPQQLRQPPTKICCECIIRCQGKDLCVLVLSCLNLGVLFFNNIFMQTEANAGEYDVPKCAEVRWPFSFDRGKNFLKKLSVFVLIVA